MAFWKHEYLSGKGWVRGADSVTHGRVARRLGTVLTLAVDGEDWESGRDYSQALAIVERVEEIETGAVARLYSVILGEWLTGSEQAEVIARNAVYAKGICASHDFCDANMAMAEAFERLGLPVADGLTDYSVWNAAWNMAKAAGFWFAPAAKMETEWAEVPYMEGGR